MSYESKIKDLENKLAEINNQINNFRNDSRNILAIQNLYKLQQDYKSEIKRLQKLKYEDEYEHIGYE